MDSRLRGNDGAMESVAIHSFSRRGIHAGSHFA
jgi:hypothetical protein